MTAAGAATWKYGWWMFAACLAAWFASLAIYGWKWDRIPGE
jgi:hypothetical protein